MKIINGFEEKSPKWDICVDGPHREKIINSLLDDDFTEESANHILQSSTNILSQCPDPNSNEEIHTKGLIYGRVQSGKTANFLSLIALSFDNGYRIAVVLGGNTEDLTKQNADRASNYYSEMEDVVVINTITEGVDLDTVRSLYLSKKKIVIVTIKTPAGISKVQKCVGNNNFPESPLLIIDDEGDQATPNNKYLKNEFSSTYSAAMNFSRSSKRTCFLSVTATPQANFLISVLDELSPDFVRLIYPGENYCGLSTFHCPDDTKYICTINDADLDLLLDPQRGIPITLSDAISDFFVGAAIREYRGDSGKHTMLIHPSGLNIDHSLVKTKIELLLLKWNHIASATVKSNGEEFDPGYSRLYKILSNSYSRFTVTCKNIPSFEKLEFLILNKIFCCKTTPLVFNGKIDSKDRKLKTQLNIVIGGNLLQRGITLPGLAVSYMPRRPKKMGNADTIEQRARWFGYKSDYIDVCRVYLISESINDFESLYDHDESLWQWAEERVALDDLKTVPRIMKLRGKLIPTRKSVTTTKSLELNEWYITNHLNLQYDENQFNLGLITKLKDSVPTGKLIKYGSGEAEKHYTVTDVPWSTVSDMLLLKFRYNHLSNCTEDTIVNLNSAFKMLNLTPNTDILWMREGYRSTRSIQADGSYGTLHTGRGRNTSGYRGERHLDVNISNIQVQIFVLNDANGQYQDGYVALAIKIPEQIQDKMCGLITNYD